VSRLISSPGQRLREAIAAPGGLVLPGAPNALTARIVEDLGFPAVYVTGAGVTNTFLGLPDLGLLGLAEMAAHVAAITGAVEIPALVDADTGYGNAVSVTHAVSVLERAGAAGIQLEDQVAPKRCGHFDGQEVIPTAEMVQKIRAARDARRDPATVIIGRTDARAAHGLDDALDRAATMADAGAEVLFIEGLLDIDELRAAGAVVPEVPKIANMVEGGKTPILPREQLVELGFSVILYANAALQAAVYGMQHALGRLLETGSGTAIEAQLTPFAERQRLVHKDRYDRMERDYRAD
jgi:2-methylisocitrate lyase-like PEP mutase family enzyme